VYCIGGEIVRNRRLFSIKRELIQKSIEAQLSAVSIFNNPNNSFKTETFIVLSIISWTYLLHAYFREKGIDYRCTERKGNSKRRVIVRTRRGVIRLWDLDTSLSKIGIAIDHNTTNNLRFLIGLRHEIEHQMTNRLDDMIGARLQASVFNFNKYLVEWFGSNYSIESQLSYCLQLSHISEDQFESMEDYQGVPAHIRSFIAEFDNSLTQEEYSSPQFAYRIIFVKKIVSNKGQADKVIEFVKPNSDIEDGLNKLFVATKEVEKPKYRPGSIVAMLREQYPNFNMSSHTALWQSANAKEAGKNYGTNVAGQWYWYESWVEYVKEHCRQHSEKYR
jgi:hypothetical protein